MNSFDDLTGKVIGGCRIERLLGQGGMGAVYKSQHLALDIPVALKLMLPSASQNPESADRFLQEARAAARLRHPAIVGVMDVGQDQGYHFIIMEYCDGINLSTLIDERKRGLTIPEAVKIAEQILDGIDYAHKNRIIHRDIKPENILIFQSGQAKLVDLGLAKNLNNEVMLTQTSVTLGSPHYIAPEQAENPRCTDGRADLYSIGCTLFHMITGKPPYSGSSPMEVILNHIQSPTPDISKLCPTLKKPLTSVIYRLMEKDPQKRYQCAADARVALVEALEFQRSVTPVKAPLKKNIIAMPSFSKKNLTTLLSIAIAVLTIAIIGIIIKQQMEKKENQKDKSYVYHNDHSDESDNIVHNDHSDKSNNTYHNDNSGKSAIKVSDKPSSVLNAVNNGDNGKLLSLLNRGVSPNAQNGAGTSPLHQAVIRKSFEATSALLDKGANPSFQDKYGDTPLHYALRDESIELVKVLLSRGTNPNIADRNNQTPLQIAKDLNRQDIIQVLKQYGAN